MNQPGSFTTLVDIGTNQKAIEEDVEDNQGAIDDDQDVVIENAQVIVEKAFLMEAEQPIIGDDQDIIKENVKAEKEKVGEGPKDVKKGKEKYVNELIEEEKEKKKEKEEKEKDEVKGIAIIDGIYYKATSPDMLLLPFLSVTNNTMTSSPNRYAQYLQKKLAKYRRKNLRTSASNLNKEDDKDQNRPIPDPAEQILNNTDKPLALTELKKSLKSFYK